MMTEREQLTHRLQETIGQNFHDAISSILFDFGVFVLAQARNDAATQVLEAMVDQDDLVEDILAKLDHKLETRDENLAASIFDDLAHAIRTI